MATRTRKKVVSKAATETSEADVAIEQPKTLPKKRRQPRQSTTRKKSTSDAASLASKTDVVRLLQLHVAGTPPPEPEAGFEARTIHPEDNPLLEVSSFLRLHKLPELQSTTLWGALPADFTRRTGLDAATVRQIIAANPGYDLYFCNPNPDTEALFHNLWMKGETSHPNFLELSQAFLKASGLTPELTLAITPSRLIAAGQMLIATPVFWTQYLTFVGETLATVRENLSPDFQAMLNSTKADPKGIHSHSTYLRFILERLFSVYLMQESANWRAYKFVAPLPEQKLNTHLRLLRRLKDRAVDEQSALDAACWMNYRALYLLQTRKEAWCKRYLQSITPDVLNTALPVAHISYVAS